MRYLALLTLPLMLAACGDAPGEDGEAIAPEAAEAVLPATLDLQATGLVVPPQNGFEQLDVPFGSMRAATEVTLGNILGDPVEQGGPNDCGLTFTAYEGVTLNFREDEFVGYWAEDPFVPEMSRAEMIGDSMVDIVEDSTIDNEFIIGDPGGAAIAGVFTGAEDDASVQALWAGENCIAR